MLGILLDQVHDKATLDARLDLYELIRKGRGSAIQTLSNSAPPMPQSVRDTALKYLPKGTKLENQDDIIKVMFSYDVIGEAKTVLAAHLNGQASKLHINGKTNGQTTEFRLCSQ